MWELSLCIPARSSHRPHGKPLSSTMLALSSSTAVAVHIACRGIHSSESQHWQTILQGDRRRLTFSFAPHTCVNFTTIFLNRMGRLHLCFCCVYIKSILEPVERSKSIYLGRSNMTKRQVNNQDVTPHSKIKERYRRLNTSHTHNHNYKIYTTLANNKPHRAQVTQSGPDPSLTPPYHTCVNFTPIFLNQTGCLHVCFHSVYTAKISRTTSNPGL